MSSYFIPGNNYTNSATAYGLRPYDELDNNAAASMPNVTYQCQAVTNTFAVFKRTRPAGSGGTANPGVLLGETLRLPIRRDATGFFVSPLGRSRGMVILRAAPDTFWSAVACPFDGNTLPVTSLNAFAQNGFKSRTGIATAWNFSSSSPYLTLTPTYSGAAADGLFSLYLCIGNTTGAAVLPKLLCQATANSATVTGTLSLEWNGRVIRTVTNGTLDLTTLGAFPAPATLPNGTAGTSTISIRATGVTALSGTFNFGMSL
jgi:hypothetical protein